MSLTNILRDLTKLVRNPAPPALLPNRFNSHVASNTYDSNGIPMVQHGGVWTYNPTTVAQWGLSGYANGNYLQAQKACDWLVEQQHPNGGFPQLYNHANHGYSLTAPWYSAISQGNALSLLSRMYALTGNPVYRLSCKHALHLLTVPTTQGGLRGTLNGQVWFEETPDPDYPNHIFNGSLWALIGIHDCLTYCGYGEDLWIEGEQSLLANINEHISWLQDPPQDTQRASLPDPWMLYDLQVNGIPVIPNYLTGFYAHVHCELIEEMAARTNNQTYTQTAQSLRTALSNYTGPY